MLLAEWMSHTAAAPLSSIILALLSIGEVKSQKRSQNGGYISACAYLRAMPHVCRRKRGQLLFSASVDFQETCVQSVRTSLRLIIGREIVTRMKLYQLISPQLITSGAGCSTFITPERVC